MWKFFRKILFALPPEMAHGLGGLFLKALGVRYLLDKKLNLALAKRKTRFSLAGFALDSPLGIAAGFDKNGSYILGLRTLGFGFIEVGTVTPLPQPGNPAPRLFRAKAAEALINRLGFNGEGAERVARRLQLLRSSQRLDFPVGINLGKNKTTPNEKAADDYVKALQILYGVSDYLIINLSSPNTPGLTELQEGDGLESILSQVREARDKCAKLESSNRKPLFLKLSPDLSDAALLVASHRALEQGFAGIIASNTTRRRDFEGISPLQAKEEGGLSGRPLAGRAKEILRFLRQELPPETCIISVGGIMSPEDVKERLDLGANLVQLYTGFVYEGPSLPLKVRDLSSRGL